MRTEKEILKMIKILENIRSTDDDIKRKVELQIEILNWVLGEPIGEGVITLADSK